MDVIAAIGSTPAALAAKAASGTRSPLLSKWASILSRPDLRGLARPGGNVTGFTNLNIELGRETV